MYREWLGAQPGEPARASSEHWITIYHSMISNGRWMEDGWMKEPSRSDW